MRKIEPKLLKEIDETACLGYINATGKKYLVCDEKFYSYDFQIKIINKENEYCVWYTNEFVKARSKAIMLCLVEEYLAFDIDLESLELEMEVYNLSKREKNIVKTVVESINNFIGEEL